MTPTDGQVLTFDTTNGWQAEDVAAAGVADHGALTGLADDDHPQYHDDARGDARYYTQAQVDALDGGNVKLTGDQTIDGIKTFNDNARFDGVVLNNLLANNNPFIFANNPIRLSAVAATAIVNDNDLINKGYVDGLDDENVKLTGNQSVAGNKTFTNELKLEYDTPILIIKQGQADQSTNIHFRDETNKIIGDMYVESGGDKRLIIRKRDGTTVDSSLILENGHISAGGGTMRSRATVDADHALTLTTKNYVDDLDDENVKLTTNQTIEGEKTFADELTVRPTSGAWI